MENEEQVAFVVVINNAPKRDKMEERIKNIKQLLEDRLIGTVKIVDSNIGVLIGVNHDPHNILFRKLFDHEVFEYVSDEKIVDNFINIYKHAILKLFFKEEYAC